MAFELSQVEGEDHDGRIDMQVLGEQWEELVAGGSCPREAVSVASPGDKRELSQEKTGARERESQSGARAEPVWQGSDGQGSV